MLPNIRKKRLQSPEDVIISQVACQRLVGDTEIAAAFEGLQAGYLDAFANTKPDETGKRELAYQHYKAVADVWAAIESRAHSAHARDLKTKADKARQGNNIG